MKNKTQIQLAQDVEISAPGLAAYESGKRVPKIELREQIAKALETDPVEIGEKVYVLIYRLYIFDENQTYLVENREMQEGEVFYI